MEETTNFEERREIRQKLRELRKKKLDALESATTTANERPRRRDRVKREEQTTIITETKTTTGDSLEPSTVQTKVEVSYSHTVATDEPSENGLENGHVESENVVEEETVSAKEENVVEEQPVEGESAAQFSIEINGEKSSQDKDEEEVVPTPQSELSTDTETVEKSSEKVIEDEPAQDNEEEEEVEEVELTPEVIEKMEDLDQLEKLVRMSQNNFFCVVQFTPFLKLCIHPRPFNPLSFNISIHILHTLLNSFALVLTRRICFTINRFL